MSKFSFTTAVSLADKGKSLVKECSHSIVVLVCDNMCFIYCRMSVRVRGGKGVMLAVRTTGRRGQASVWC